MLQHKELILSSGICEKKLLFIFRRQTPSGDVFFIFMAAACCTAPATIFHMGISLPLPGQDMLSFLMIIRWLRQRRFLISSPMSVIQSGTI